MPPINISRPRIKNVTLMADAAEMPNAPSAKTWLASSAPSPPGKGTRNASKPAVVGESTRAASSRGTFAKTREKRLNTGNWLIKLMCWAELQRRFAFL